MRPAFAYETNGLLLRRLLVPDPLEEREWERAMTRWREEGGGASCLEWLVKEGVLTEERLLVVLAERSGVKGIGQDEEADPWGGGADGQVLRSNGFRVLSRAGRRWRVAGGPDLPPRLEAYIGKGARDWEWVLLTPVRRNGPGAGQPPGPGPGARETGDTTELEAWVHGLLEEARARGAADLHFERSGDHLRIRTHGPEGMQTQGEWGLPRSQAALRLLKRWAGFSTAQQSTPQDGRLLAGPAGRETVFRASHVCTIDGESLVLRVIGTEARIPEMTSLGVPPELAASLTRMVLQESGLLICSGATGSGKTTTLYALLGRLGQANRKIMTIEDPVEYELGHAIQSSVNGSGGWTFATAVRAYLRQDPDIILVGEIRDQESAEVAARAGLTGHAVLSSLHASSPLTALERLHGWGLPPGLLGETVRLVSHQRLVRDVADGPRRALFQWIEPEPVETVRYLETGHPLPVHRAG